MLLTFLTVVFAIHIIVFGFLYYKKRQNYYLLLVATFHLLIISLWMESLVPNFRIFDIQAYVWTKGIAHAFTVFSTANFLYRRVWPKISLRLQNSKSE